MALASRSSDERATAQRAAERESRDHARREKLEKLHDQLTEGVASLAADGQWQRSLAVARRFHCYTFWNTLAIVLQRPDATYAVGYPGGQAMGRQVRNGEHRLTILAPVKRLG